MKATFESPFPRTFEEFLEWFSSEEDCAKYLEWIRWPEGFICPECEGTKAWRTDRGLWHCQGCQRQSSVTAGTVFEDSRKPLRLWFHVMWVLMAQKTGLSAKNLCDTYGFGSYQTAWGWLRKLRSVMVRLAANVSPGEWKWMKPMWAGKRKEPGDAEQRVRPWFLSR